MVEVKLTASPFVAKTEMCALKNRLNYMKYYSMIS